MLHTMDMNSSLLGESPPPLPSKDLSLCLLLPLTSSFAIREGRGKKTLIAFSSLIDRYFPWGGGRWAKRRVNIWLDNLSLAQNQSCFPPEMRQIISRFFVEFCFLVCWNFHGQISLFTFCEWGPTCSPMDPPKPFVVSQLLDDLKPSIIFDLVVEWLSWCLSYSCGVSIRTNTINFYPRANVL